MRKEAIAKFYSTYRLFIFPAIVTLSSLFLIFFLIYPQTAKLIENQKLTGDLVSKSKFLESKAVALESYDKADLSRKVEAVLNAYPADKDFGNILGLLQQTTEQFGFSITSLSLANTSGKLGNAESYTVKVELKGTRVLVPALLNNLENLPRLVRVSGIDATANQLSQSLDASLTVEVLYSKLPQSFGTADSPLPEISQKDEALLAILAGARSTAVVSSPTGPLSPRGKSNPFE